MIAKKILLSSNFNLDSRTKKEVRNNFQKSSMKDFQKLISKCKYIGTYHLKVATGGILVQIIFFYFHKVQVLKGITTIHHQVQEVQSSVFTIRKI